MIEINLLPEELRGKKKAEEEHKLPKFTTGPALIWVVTAIVAMQAMLWISIGFKSRQKAKLVRQWQELAPQQMLLESAKRDNKRFSRRLDLLRSSTTERKFYWAEKLDSFLDCIPSGIWLNEIIVKDEGKEEDGEDKGSGYMMVAGRLLHMRGEEEAVVGKFVANMKANPVFFAGFKDVDLEGIYTEIEDDVEVKGFKLKCYLEE